MYYDPNFRDCLKNSIKGLSVFYNAGDLCAVQSNNDSIPIRNLLPQTLPHLIVGGNPLNVLEGLLGYMNIRHKGCIRLGRPGSS